MATSLQPPSRPHQFPHWDSRHVLPPLHCDRPHLALLPPLRPHFSAVHDDSMYYACSRDQCTKYAKVHGLCLAHCGAVNAPPLPSPVTRMPSVATYTDTTPKRKKRVPSRPCSFDGCAKAAKRKGVCMDHGGRHICKVDDCQKCAHKGGFCIGHGGGRRCSVDGCGKSAQAGGTCYSHGGGKHGSRIYCKWEGCQKCAHKGGFCIAHGGGRRCDVEGCTRSAQVGGSCYSHGGGKRCRVDGCNHAGRLRGLCIRHKKVSDMDSLGADPVKVELMA